MGALDEIKQAARKLSTLGYSDEQIKDGMTVLMLRKSPSKTVPLLFKRCCDQNGQNPVEVGFSIGSAVATSKVHKLVLREVQKRGFKLFSFDDFISYLNDRGVGK